MNAPNLESATPNPSPDRRIVGHHPIIERHYGDGGEFIIALCLCGWFDDECIGPATALRRWEEHRDWVLSHD